MNVAKQKSDDKHESKKKREPMKVADYKTKNPSSPYPPVTGGVRGRA